MRQLGRNMLVGLVVLVPLLLAGLLFSVSAGQSRAGLYPWWETPSLVVLLTVPYVVAVLGLIRDRRAARGLALVAAGVGSLVPAVFTLTLLIGLGLFVLAVVLIAIGVAAVTIARSEVRPRAIVATFVSIALFLAAPFARFTIEGERCVRTFRDPAGVETHEVFTPVHDNGHTVLAPPPGVVSEACTSEYTSALEATGSVVLSVAGAVVAILGTRPSGSTATRQLA